jgi:hypothetical protein
MGIWVGAEIRIVEIGRTVAGLSEQDGIGFIGHVVFGLEVGAASRNRNRMGA